MSTHATVGTYQTLCDTLERVFDLGDGRTGGHTGAAAADHTGTAGHTGAAAADHIDVEPDTGSPLELVSYPFSSANWRVHPAEDARNTDSAYRDIVSEHIERFPYSERNFFHRLQPSDRDVPENLRFRYPVFVPKPATARFDRAIVLLHGLNEKSWSKYLPWAHRLAEQTGRPVILFPIAFHMNRAPRVWSNPREMITVSHERKRLFPGVEASSFVNAALSHRVHFAPHRFLTSGLQSYYDVTDLVRSIKSGTHELFTEGARVDVFGYSIGAMLSQLLLLSDPAGLFADSRAFLFCGGSVMDQTQPVSKAIMDSEAHRALHRFSERLLADSEPTVPRGVQALQGGVWEVETAKSLLLTEPMRAVRERAARTVGHRMTALAMMKDRVFPPAGITASWQTADGTMLMEVDTADPPYEYAHERPFPTDSEAPSEVDRFFTEMISRAAAHFAGRTA